MITTMHYRYAIAEGALYKPLKWKETSGSIQEFPNESDMLKHAELECWDLVTVLASGTTGTYRQWFFKQTTE